MAKTKNNEEEEEEGQNERKKKSRKDNQTISILGADLWCRATFCI